jgi:hypothetical protein
MKRIIPFLLLAVAFGACQDEGPTVPSDGPLLAVNCDKHPDHPKCPPEPEPDKQYTAIDLKKACSLCGGAAHDISEPVDGSLHVVVGWIDQPLDSPNFAAVWTGTVTSIGDQDPDTLWTEVTGPQGTSPAHALGINDEATLIVGIGNRGPMQRFPVIWQLKPGGGWWQGQELALLDTHNGGDARDVNDGRRIVGRLTSETDIVASMWSSPMAAVDTLYRPPDFFSAALGLNNQNDVVGWIWKASGEQEQALKMSFAI